MKTVLRVLSFLGQCIMIVDAYAHCARNKYLPIERLEAAEAEAGVEGVLLVQHLGEHDNSYLASIVRHDPVRYRAIGLIDTGREAAADCLAALLDGRTHGVPFSGVRMARSMLEEAQACLEVLQSHRATLVVHLPDGIGAHVDLLRGVAGQFPGVRIYVPHLGWPVVQGRASPRWREAVGQMRDLGQVVFGISAMYYFSRKELPHEDVWPYIRHLIETLGPGRCVWGSDFPLLLEKESVKDNQDLFSSEAMGLSQEEQEAVLGGTAAACWGF